MNGHGSPMMGMSTIITKYAPPAPKSIVCVGAVVTKTIINPIPNFGTTNLGKTWSFLKFGFGVEVTF